MRLPTSHYVESFVGLPASPITWFCLHKWVLGLQCFWLGTVITHWLSGALLTLLFWKVFFPPQRCSSVHQSWNWLWLNMTRLKNEIISYTHLSSVHWRISYHRGHVRYGLYLRQLSCSGAVVSWLSPQRSVFSFALWWERLPPVLHCQLLTLPGDRSTLQVCFITRTYQECTRTVEVCTGVCSGHCWD